MDCKYLFVFLIHIPTTVTGGSRGGQGVSASWKTQLTIDVRRNTGTEQLGLIASRGSLVQPCLKYSDYLKTLPGSHDPRRNFLRLHMTVLYHRATSFVPRASYFCTGLVQIPVATFTRIADCSFWPLIVDVIEKSCRTIH